MKIRPAKSLLLCLAGAALGASRLCAADFTVAASFPTYTINGQGNLTLTLRRGSIYTFAVSATSHPFYIKTNLVAGTGSAYNAGVTNNGLQNGTLTFAVPTNAPATLFYICSLHSSMAGTINITDPPVVRIVSLTVSSNLVLLYTGTNAASYTPQSTTNLAAPSWSALTVQTNRLLPGTNEMACDLPPGTNVFIRLRAQ